ncbi:SUR7/PalI family protein [Aspergillus affinis]|uniref:SUR7/PalI family protein n=1 Tax=Aspergillus affinis TaxID=1070780 RepID=UPI0022FE96E2|nr:SUR7/PalI family protein [Aspergillus affinis]KAI9041739.1 SUR7/PalI family protein [Aspergillus affinis]
MPTTSKLHVAIYGNSGMFNHWSLFVEGPTEPQKMIFHVMGTTKMYRYEKRISNARNSATLVELMYLCDVDNSKLQTIEDAAKDITLHNERENYCWECLQAPSPPYYVLDLLESLEKKDVLDPNDPKYNENKAAVMDKEEGMT